MARSESSWRDGGREFPSTSWTLVDAAGAREAEASREALAELCRIYWYPLYAYVRRKGNSPSDAADLTQEFFAALLARDAFGRVDREKGRFRTFLLACCRNFLANQNERARTLKRGGGKMVLPIDFDDAEHRYSREPADLVDADALFEKRWALALVEEARGHLEAEYRASGRSDLFAALLAGLLGEPDAPPYADVARRMGLSEAAVKKAAQRLRERFAVALRHHVAATVAATDEVEDELRALMSALAS